MENVLDVLHERGFIQDLTEEPELRKRLEQGPITLYHGIDATAESLHIGNLFSIMAMAWYQRFGHRPIALMGAGTSMIGDPTFREASRPILSKEAIDQRVERFRPQVARFLDFSNDKALLLNNADWLMPLNLIDFMRDIGARFSVNEVLRLEAYRTRLEAGGLSFLEFSYFLLQSYDFLYLYRNYDCILQIGGSDQWGNSIMGADLVRRVTGGQAFVAVSPLLTAAGGAKMGKSVGNAPWLSAEMTSPYDYYQYWRNVGDAQVGRLLPIYTFLAMEQIRELASAEGAELNRAKEVLAFEATRLLHGEEEAESAREAARALFVGGEGGEDVPTAEIDCSRLEDGIPVTELCKLAGVAASANQARTLINQGGLTLNGERVTDARLLVTRDAMQNGHIMLRAGKKQHKRLICR
jgi:tyrosyl-tRNA synthetase